MIERFAHVEDIPIVARVKPLSLDDQLDWESERAWFDAVACIARERATQNLRQWDELGPHVSQQEHDDSYSGWDFDLWDYVQSERDMSQTISGCTYLGQAVRSSSDVKHTIPTINTVSMS